LFIAKKEILISELEYIVQFPKVQVQFRSFYYNSDYQYIKERKIAVEKDIFWPFKKIIVLLKAAPKY